MKTNYPSYRHPSFSGLIGVATEDITPSAGIYLGNWGAAKSETATGVHRPLMLHCCTFRAADGEQPLVLISADLGWWKDMHDERFLRDGILASLQLAPENLMFCLSHTHSGPSLCRSDSEKPGGEYIEQYLLNVQRAAINAVHTSLSNALPATLAWTYGRSGLAANRDLPDEENERIVVGFNPAQPADDTLLVGRITDEQGNIICVIINYACHPTTLAWDNLLISPDYVGAMRELVESFTGAPCLFLQGASGELAPAEQYSGDTSIADRHGRQLGHAVLSSLESMLPPKMELSLNGIIESAAPLALWSETKGISSAKLSARMTNVELPLKKMPSFFDIEKQWKDCKPGFEKEKLWRKLNIRKSIGDGETMSSPLWIWRLGDSLLIGQPNEAYSQFQQELRQQFPSYAIAVMNVVNGHTGYLPPQHLYEKNIYPVWQTPFAKGSLGILTAAAKEMAYQMIKEQ